MGLISITQRVFVGVHREEHLYYIKDTSSTGLSVPLTSFNSMEMSLFSFMVSSILSYVASSFEQNEEQINQPKFCPRAFGLNQFFNSLIYAYETCQRLLLFG